MPESWSAFDVIGPVMLGPSSSHTAGAAKIGYFARIINGQQPKQVKLLLHGSFGKVYQGHRTDKAIIGGLLGFLPHSDEIKQADELAQQAGMAVELTPTNLGDGIHPNSVRIEMTNADGTFHRVRAKSIGGGKIVIREIDKIECQMDMSYSSLIVLFDNREVNALELIEKVKNLNVHIVSFETQHYKDRTLLNVEIREQFSIDIIKELEKIPGIELVRFLNHISNYDKYCS
ncbi:MAG: L-serine ammonia-lyase, iron-sulfur-dependent subunit beta [bacterium]|nr:L-serine ammonia-lyase, iron-sulfur-dependent subunit beta [bacterium]